MMKIRTAPSFATIVASIATSTLSATALADEVVLVGGDVLRGTVVGETDAAVVLDHPALGRIEVARERIASVKVDAKQGRCLRRCRSRRRRLRRSSAR